MSLRQDSLPTDLISKKDSSASKQSSKNNQESSVVEGSVAEITAIDASVAHTPPLKKLNNQELPKTNVEGLPEDETLEHPTEIDDPKPDVLGEFTDDLSDITEEGAQLQTRTANVFTSWYSKIQPLIRNKRVRAYSAANFMLFVINFILLIALIVYAAMTTNSGIDARRHLMNDKPCLYEFTEWSKCSAECKINNFKNNKTRKVIPESIVVARGRFALQSPCPDNLENLVEVAPCNTHTCPVKLGSFEFKKHRWPIDANDLSKGCYTIRDIPASDVAVIIDGEKLVKKVSCEIDFIE